MKKKKIPLVISKIPESARKEFKKATSIVVESTDKTTSKMRETKNGLLERKRGKKAAPISETKADIQAPISKNASVLDEVANIINPAIVDSEIIDIDNEWFRLKEITESNFCTKNGVEIKDDKLITLISTFIKEVPMGANLLNGLKNDKVNEHLIEEASKLYQVIIPSGERLAKVAGKADEFRGITVKDGAKGISGHAILKKADFSDLKVKKFSPLSVANLMQINSMIVGQYYMNTIDQKLNELSKATTQITQFLEDDMFAILEATRDELLDIEDRFIEIINNQMKINNTLIHLQSYRKDIQRIIKHCEKKLMQMLSPQETQFKDYEQVIINFEKWLEVYDLSLKLLLNLYKLEMMFGGRESMPPSLKKQNVRTEEIRTALINYHQYHIKYFGIDLNQGLKLSEKRLVKIKDKFLTEGTKSLNSGKKLLKRDDALPSQKPSEFKTMESLDESLLNKIKHQSSANTLTPHPNIESDDTKIIIKNQKFYYLSN